MSNLDSQEVFTIFLPSDASYDLYQNNTLSQYVINLPEPIKLNRNYEVALTEIIYPNNILNVPMDMNIYLRLKKHDRVITLLKKNFSKGLYISEDLLFKNIQQLINDITNNDIIRTVK